MFFMSALESRIKVAPGKFGIMNKRSPIHTLYLYYSRDSGTIVFTSKIVFSINEQLTIVFRAVDNCLQTSGQLSS